LTYVKRADNVPPHQREERQWTKPLRAPRSSVRASVG
jgi:hypothetical protein